MTLEQFIKDNNLQNGIYKDNFNKIFPKLIKRYKYIDVHEYWYDDEENPNCNTWIDIEGIEYGWLWCNCKTEGKMRKIIRQYARDIYNGEIVYIFNQNNIKHIVFIDKNREETLVKMIRLSNNKFNCF